jgi:hypothetical protein
MVDEGNLENVDFKDIYDNLDKFFQFDSEAYRGWLALVLDFRTFKEFDSPLHTAARYGIMGLLRRYTADPACDINAKNENQDTPLHLACQGDGEYHGL